MGFNIAATATIRSLSMLRVIGIVGAGAMGKGIAQLIAQSGFQVLLFDSIPEVADMAKQALFVQWDQLEQKQKITPHVAATARSHLHVVEVLEAMHVCDLVIEAIVEKLDVKQQLFHQLDQIVKDECILATNTSSLSVTAIAAGSRLPSRVAGLHFFNPVPLMKVVEVINGLLTAAHVPPLLQALINDTGHAAVFAKDTPGFIVNHAGRGYVTEALRILQENVADFTEIDQIMRGAAGFRLGPFELMDLTGLDVSHPVMESIYHQYYEEPRYRPNYIAAQRVQAGVLGRKTGQGFYSYPPVSEAPLLPQETVWQGRIWLSPENPLALDALHDLCERIDIVVDYGHLPAADAVAVVSPDGEDVSTCVARLGLNPRRTIGIDSLNACHGHLTLMLNPATDLKLAQGLQLRCAQHGMPATLIQDSAGFVVQRVLATIINIACDIVQQGICSPQDLDQAVLAGLAYPFGPLAWGDKLGASRILSVLRNMQDSTGDPRYRPSPWLVRRAQLGLSLLHVAER
ncbi:3-hydroxyacyl-CoA dehydrogenase [Undibacterium oligocarboniphilum]|uniref:3-hydroxyacyl-CoA dehydrogenase n=2 Tax=Undibacterium oligocarboniphilum TaxID=666702 RepID=A0A850QKX0_9BURK|nr:3-hydroxyacyl-CoA dehydrogenase [Undibacterium oligocarboniphilum]NVO78043.1 3-hydroxyacyl-CoA dehydrogenase [Undibacterium oligocarboniphilum]